MHDSVGNTPKKPRRSPGTGSITELGPGRFWARLPCATGKTLSLDVWPTYEEASGVLNASIARLAQEQMTAVGGTTLTAYMPAWIDRREKTGICAVDSERSRMRCHVLTAPFATIPMKTIQRADVEDWVEELGRKLKSEVATLSLVLLRQCLDHALRRKLITENPASGVRIKKAARTEEPWTFLEPAEQSALLAVIPEPERWIVAFNIGTGLRRGEMWCLELRDLHVDGDDPHVWVRYGSPGRPPKGKKMRRVSLFGLGLEAANAWLAALPNFATSNDLQLVFPGRHGARRRRAIPEWSSYVDRAGITRNVRWHDLRHTFASSLVAGWWGRRWRLEEVKEEMGHASIKQTERYAHLGDTARKQAAREARDCYGNMATLTIAAETKPILLASPGTRRSQSSPAVSNSSASLSRAHGLAELTLQAIAEKRDDTAQELALLLARRTGAVLAPSRVGFWARATELCQRILRMSHEQAASLAPRGVRGKAK